MRKLSLVVAGAFATVAAWVAPSLLASQPSTVRFEYLQVTPFSVPRDKGQWVFQERAYRACVAGSSEWTCRRFEPVTRTSGDDDSALRAMLATLGSEGWELVSVVDNTPDGRTGLSYLFKRLTPSR